MSVLIQLECLYTAESMRSEGSYWSRKAKCELASWTDSGPDVVIIIPNSMKLLGVCLRFFDDEVCLSTPEDLGCLLSI